MLRCDADADPAPAVAAPQPVLPAGKGLHDPAACRSYSSEAYDGVRQFDKTNPNIASQVSRFSEEGERVIPRKSVQ